MIQLFASNSTNLHTSWMYLSYSAWKSYIECPRKYWHQYIAKTSTPPENKVNSLYGSAVGYVFEDFYAKKLWATPDPEKSLQNIVESSYEKAEKSASRNAVLNWKDPKANYHNPEDIKEEVRASISRGLASIKKYELVGPKCAAEVVLDCQMEGHTIAGRADFIIRRSNNDLLIVDGKGSKWFGAYVDANQLLWYGALWKIKSGSYPTHLGFLYWRSEPDNAVDWVDPLPASMEQVMDRALYTIRKVLESKDKQNYNTSPSNGCSLCKFKSVCPEGASWSSKSLKNDTNEEDILL